MEEHSTIEQWFLKYNSYVTNFLVYYTGSTDVEDLVQECFIKAMKGMNQFEGKADPKTWLVSIARRVAIDYQRKRRKLNYLPDNDLHLIPSNEKLLEETFVHKENLKKVYSAINEMKKNYRDVLILRGIMDMTVSETAKVLGWNEKKVNITLHRALKKLRLCSREGEEEMANEV